jgi:guanylate kinase
MRQVIALYGPPGSGKSTLVRLAVDRGFAAVDAEKLGDSYEMRRDELRARLAQQTIGTVLVGAADLHPEDFPDGTKFVLLLPSAEVLEKRVVGRGDMRTHKWVDHALKVRTEHSAMKQKFDHVIEIDQSPDETLDQILGSR